MICGILWVVTIDSETEAPGEAAQRVRIRTHTLHADSAPADTGPSPHDLFDAALATCKTITAHWYAKKHGIPLERVESHVTRDDRDERRGTYRLKVTLAYHGPLDDAQRAQLHDAVSRCPIHKLMTTTDVVIDVAPLPVP